MRYLLKNCVLFTTLQIFKAGCILLGTTPFVDGVKSFINTSTSVSQQIKYEFLWCMFSSQLRKQLVEKSKDGTSKAMSNGDIQKSVPKKRGRWDQTAGDEGVAPVKKKATSNSISSVGSLCDKEDVRLFFLYFNSYYVWVKLLFCLDTVSNALDKEVDFSTY